MSTNDAVQVIYLKLPLACDLLRIQLRRFINMLSLGFSILMYLSGGLLLLVLAAFLAFTAYIYYIHWKYSHIPSPKMHSFYLGHMAEFLEEQKVTGNRELPFQTLLHKWSQDAGSSIFVLYFVTMALVISIDPEYNKEVTMQSKCPKPYLSLHCFRKLMGERFLGNSVLTILDYDTWKPKRQLYDPAFKKSHLKTLITPFNECVDKFIEKIRPLADGKTTVPMKQHLAELTLDVISKVAFGTDFTQKWNSKTVGLKRVKGDESLLVLVNTSLKGVDKVLKMPFYQYLHPLESEDYRETVRAIRMIGRDCIKERIGKIESGEQVPSDILTYMLQMASSKASVDIEDLVDDFVNFYIAGQETTANLLAFTTVLIHQHPCVLERLQAEVDEVLGDKGIVTAEDLEKLQYTEQVLLETLRTNPPAFGISKESPRDGMKLGGYYIPAGTHITMPTSVLCRMPEYFDNPDVFDPSRWDPENKRPSAFVYFPFGVGHRACIGKHFAMMEAKMAVARLIQTYKLTLPADYTLITVQRATDQPKGCVPCIVENRKTD